MDEFPWETVRRELAAAQRVAVVSHVGPDGDAVGSVLGLGWSLRAAGKQVSLALADGVPGNLRHLPGVEDIRRRVGPVDFVIAVDAGDRARLGEALPAEVPVDVNIDHHKTNTRYARYNWVDPTAVSTTSLLYTFITRLGLPLPREAAAALLTGLVTDTIGFRTSNMTPQALRLAAELMEQGADLPTLYFKALVERPYEALRFWGAGLSRLRREGPLVWTWLTLADRAATGYNENNDADLVNYLTAVQGCAVGVIFLERPDGTVKVSWRARPGWDVSQVAVQFGGGGHPPAAGATVSGSLAEVRERVLEATRALIQTRAHRPE